MAESDTSLRALFDRATSLQKQIETLLSTSQEYQDSLRQAIADLEECRELARRASLFSPNETEDDIASNDLQYLSIDFYLGDLVQKQIRNERKPLLLGSQAAYGRFLGLLDTYDLLSKSDKKLYERYDDDKNGFTLITGADATARRETKISRFQRERDLKQKLDHLSRNPQALANDDAALRDLRKAELDLHTHETFYALDMIAQELKMLAMAPPELESPETLERDYRERMGLNNEVYSERLDSNMSGLLRNTSTGPILSKSGRPLQPFTLLDSRKRLQSGVFRPSHNLPTMTIDEYLDEERRRGGIIEGGGDRPEKVVDEDDLEAADRETIKARDWDEFKEANPKGSGNTLNRG